MICPKCNKYYFKKSYLDKHIKANKCVKKNNSTDDIDDIEEAIRNATKSIIDKVKPVKILEKGMDEIINKVVVDNNDNLRTKVDMLTIELNLLKERINILEKMEYKMELEKDDSSEKLAMIPYNSEKQEIKTVKNERIIMDDEVIKQYLSCKDVESDAEILAKYYFDGIKRELHPIRRSKKNECLYWNGFDWVQDNGTNLKSILSNNLRKLYTKINIVADNNKPNADYLHLQEHINNLNTKKYQMQLYLTFIEKYCV